MGDLPMQRDGGGTDATKTPLRVAFARQRLAALSFD